jgi:hypothetical protein
LTVDVRHVARFVRAFRAAERKLEELGIGVDIDEGTLV